MEMVDLVRMPLCPLRNSLRSQRLKKISQLDQGLTKSGLKIQKIRRYYCDRILLTTKSRG
jgi:hypothetical protein